MKMKKTLMAVVLAAAIGTIGLQQASARTHEGRGTGDSPHRQFHQLDDASKQKILKFQGDTQDLRKQIAMKRAEEVALARNENPDMTAVQKTAGELFDLRLALQEKAKAAGVFLPSKKMDENVATKVKKVEGFLAETKDLRKQVFVKRAAERALMESRTPNVEAVTKVSGELFDLKSALREKAIAAGIDELHRFGDGKMGPERRFHHERGFGMMGDNETMQIGPDMGGDPLFAGD